MRTAYTTMGLLMIGALFVGCRSVVDGDTNQKEAATVMKGIHGFKVETITGESITLGAYEGKVLLVVNVASKCGFTRQYKGLEELYRKYKDQGLVVLGFPANDFGRQEPGTNAEIQQFCTTKFDVSFPMFAKIHVSGDEQHPLYGYLTSKEKNPEHAGRITWNFNKFLINKQGQVIGRFGSRTKPMDDDLIKAVEAALTE